MKLVVELDFDGDSEVKQVSEIMKYLRERLDGLENTEALENYEVKREKELSYLTPSYFIGGKK